MTLLIFREKKVVNFDIIHHECRGDTSEGIYRNYKTVESADFKSFPENDFKKNYWWNFQKNYKGPFMGKKRANVRIF